MQIIRFSRVGLTLIVCLLCTVLSSPFTMAQENNQAPTSSNTAPFVWLLKPQLAYTYVLSLSDGLAVTNRGGYFNIIKGYVDGGKFGYVSKTGQEVVAPIYSDARGFSEGLAAVRNEEKKWGFIDKKGNRIIPFEYEDVEPFSNGLSWVKKDGKWGYIDKKGNNVLPFKYAEKKDITNQLVQLIVKADYSQGVYNKVRRTFIIKEDTYDDIQYGDGLFEVRKNGKNSYVNMSGQVVIPYSSLKDRLIDGPFHDGMAQLREESKADDYWRLGFIDKSGKTVIPPKYRKVGTYFSEGVIAVSENWDRTTQSGTFRLIDKTGKDVLGRDLGIFSDVFPFYNGLAVVQRYDAQKKSYLQGLIDKTGKLIIPVEYDSVDYVKFYYDLSDGTVKYQPYPNGIILIKKLADPKYKRYYTGIADANGNVLLEPDKYKGRVVPYSYDSVAQILAENAFMLINIHTGQEEMFAFYKWISNEYSIIAKRAEYSPTGEPDHKFYFYDSKGTRIFPLSNEEYFSDAYVSPEGITVEQNGKWGILSNPNDTPSDWAKPEVEKAFSLNLIPDEMKSGYISNISRADFSKLIVHLLEVKTGKTVATLLAEKNKKIDSSAFSDTSDPDILAAYSLGIVGGKGNGVFDLDGDITRQEAAVMLARTANILGISPTNSPLSFTDNNDIASWAKGSVSAVTSIKDKTNQSPVMGSIGNNNFSPKASYTKQQAFITLKRLFNAL
ncbi:WG repeat-containing protein [Cohnella massiliensis]|uniref:WG repeat-containing protein n=1 Tax=Cohnella massiliensis TaxID=1816691 RepID=UPI0009BAD7E0|nr:WG repeat-containing protein [Cohnella massiliensis]